MSYTMGDTMNDTVGATMSDVMDETIGSTSLLEKPKLPQVLRKLMAEINISEAQLARKTKIPQPTLHRILSGATKSPRGESLSPLAKFFSISISQLIGDEPLPSDRIPGEHNPGVIAWSSVPILSWDLAALWPACKIDLKKDQWSNWVTTDREITPNTFAVRVEGQSMLPRFAANTVLVIEPSIEAKDGDFVVVHLEKQSKATFKQFLIDGPDRYLRPLNPEFKTIELNREYRMVGVLIQSREDFHRLM